MGLPSVSLTEARGFEDSEFWKTGDDDPTLRIGEPGGRCNIYFGTRSGCGLGRDLGLLALVSRSKRFSVLRDLGCSLP